MAIIQVLRRMAPMTNRVKRVGCKKSIPTRKNAPPVKKKILLAELIDDEWQDSLTSTARWIPVSHQKIGEEMIFDLENEQVEATFVTEFSAEGGDSDLKEMPLDHDAAKVHFSAEGGDPDLQHMPLDHDTAKTHFAEGGDSDLQHMPLDHDTAKTHFSAEGGDSDLQHMPLDHDTVKTHFSAEGGDSDLQHIPFDHDTAKTHFSAEGGDSDLQDMPLDHDPAKTHFSAEGSVFNDIKEATGGVSQVNKWVCHACNVAEATITVLPCCHLCLCLDHEENWDDICPVCGGPNDDSFYMRI